MNNLEKKNIIVTGATGGIGTSIIKKLSENGANIIASGTKIEKLEELKKKFNRIKILKFDISNHEKIEKFIEDASRELGGNFDCIVNNAGIAQDNLAIRMSLDEWKKVIDINLTSTFLICKFAIKNMLKNKKGKIINITSVVGHTGNLGQTNYTASKAITNSTVSKLSAPKSSIKLDSSVTFDSSIPRWSATIFLTLLETSSDILILYIL